MEQQKVIVTTKSELQEIIKEVIEQNPQPKVLPNTKEEYLSQTEAAKFLKITKATLIDWKKKKIIPFYQHGRTVLFLKSELLDALRNNSKLNKE